MASFQIVALGVGDTFSERHHGSSLLLMCDGFLLGVDCPDTYRAVLAQAAARSGLALSLVDIDHMLITHVHGDHMNGLEGVAFFKYFAQKQRLRLLVTPEVRSVIWEHRLRASMEQLWNGQEFRSMSFDDYFDLVPLAWSETTELGPFRIEIRRTRHHVPTTALRIHAAGRTFGYSSDTAFDPGLIEFLAPADLIVHETNLGPAHTPYAELAALAPALRQRMRLIHYPDSFDTQASVIEVLREGQVVDV